jgi:hypothetical protein
MSRVCVIDVAGLSCRLLRRAGGLWMNALRSPPRPLRATFPSVAASVQSSMTTGAPPGLHGVVAGGVFRRQCRSLGLDERSNTLLSKKRFWHSRELPRRLQVGLVFWSNPLAGAADAVLGAVTYAPSSQLIADIPVGLYERVAAQLGPFDPRWVRGPTASGRASQWIAPAAELMWRDTAPDLLWVYLPGLNFEATRHGLDSAEALAALRQVDALAASLAQAVAASGGQTLLVSDGGYVAVRQAVFPNEALLRAGLLKVCEADEGPMLDVENSRAFAMVDHQVAHVYCDDEQAAGEAEAVLAGLDGVAAVKRPEELFCEGPGRYRAGERILLARSDAWLAYRWWDEDSPPPPLATATDVVGKCGYDPCELFAGPREGTIDPRPQLVRSSRGLADAPLDDQCVLGATWELPAGDTPDVTAVPGLLRTALFGESPIASSQASALRGAEGAP